MSLRVVKRQLLRLAIHGALLMALLIGALIATIAGSEGGSAFFGLLVLAYALTLRVNPLPRVVERCLIHDVE